uniref:ERAP1_C domain-containing protein n=1 Tax=Parastrongyloides trichosuri TaxID=131310 RepID=A0A0N4Z0X1_PARTI
MTSSNEYHLIDNFYGIFKFLSNQNDKKSEQYNVLEIEVVKRANNSDILIGRKTFKWPDLNFPSTINYDVECEVLKMESSSYVGELALVLPRNAITVGKGVRQPVKILKGFSTEPHEVSINNAFLGKLKQCLSKMTNNCWNDLCKEAKNFIASPVDLVDHFNYENEKDVINMILKKENSIEIVFKALVLGKFFSMESLEYLVDKFIENDNCTLLKSLIIEGSTTFNDITFGKLLKYVVNQKNEKTAFELFKKLLGKGFGSNMLATELEKVLSVEDAMKLFEWLINLPANNDDSELFGKMIDFSNILLDSHFHKFVWDDVSHDLLRRFYAWTQSWTYMAETYTSFKESAEVMKALSTEIENLLTYNSGYTIRKVTLQCTPLC